MSVRPSVRLSQVFDACCNDDSSDIVCLTAVSCHLLQSLVNYLDCWTGECRNDVPLKTAIMGFINAALKYGPGQVRSAVVAWFNVHAL